MDLSSSAFSTIVSQPSGQSRLDLITPYDSSASYLWHKINGTQATVGGTGSQMPRGGPYLSAADLALIEAWIDEGAQN